MVGWVHFNARRYDTAIDQWQAVLEIEPDYPLALYNIGLALTLQGRYDDAVDAFQRAGALWAGTGTEILAEVLEAGALALSGETERARVFLEQMELRYRTQGGVSPTSIAGMHYALGNDEQTFVWLEKAYHERDPNLVTVTSEPWFDALRADPRFVDLRRRMGLE
jgi:tetratricopeptide (TPR) repeat protein